jgi:hypothetical protein
VAARIECKANAQGTLREVRLLEAAPEWSDLAAADDSGAPALRKFTMVAYTGGPMKVDGFFRPVVVDLAGLKGPKQLPMFVQHDPTRIVGHGEVEILPQQVRASGVVSGAGPAAAEVVASSRNGFPWQASIGATITELEVLREGEKATVNGRQVSGPVLIARKADLNEISFVPLGADRKTSARVAAQHQKDESMDFQDWLKAQGFDPEQLGDKQRSTLEAAFKAQQAPPAAGGNAPGGTPAPAGTPDLKAGAKGSDGADLETVELQASRQRRAAELERVAAIEAIEGIPAKIAAQAVKEGWTVEKAELATLRAARPTAPAGHAHSAAADVNELVIQAAVCRTGQLDSVEEHFDDKTLSAADKYFRRGLGLQQLILLAAATTGYHARDIRGDLENILRAAFSTASLSGILSNTANKFLLSGFMAVEQAWRLIAARRPVNDFKQITSYRMTGANEYLEVGPTGELKHGKLDEESYTNQARTYGRLLAITRTMIRNDDLGALSDLPRKLGRGGALKLNDVFWTAFLANTDFFKSDNNNYFEGAATNLQSSSLKTAVEKFRKQVDADGKPLGAMPKFLLVPPEEEVTADELFFSTNHNTGGAASTAKVPNRNVFAGKYQPVMSAYLSNSSYTGYSTTAWYLLADPEDVPVIEVCFLDGVETPTIESAAADFDQLGINLRGYWDFGVAKQDHRGGVKSKGAA